MPIAESRRESCGSSFESRGRGAARIHIRERERRQSIYYATILSRILLLLQERHVIVEESARSKLPWLQRTHALPSYIHIYLYAQRSPSLRRFNATHCTLSLVYRLGLIVYAAMRASQSRTWNSCVCVCLYILYAYIMSVFYYLYAYSALFWFIIFVIQCYFMLTSMIIV